MTAHLADERPSILSYDRDPPTESTDEAVARSPVKVRYAVRRNYGCPDPVKPVIMTEAVQRAIDWAWTHGGCRSLRRVPEGDVFQTEEDVRGFWQICSPSTLGPDVCSHPSTTEELELHWSVEGGPTQVKTFLWGRPLNLEAGNRDV